LHGTNHQKKQTRSSLGKGTGLHQQRGRSEKKKPHLKVNGKAWPEGSIGKYSPAQQLKRKGKIRGRVKQLEHEELQTKQENSLHRPQKPKKTTTLDEI